MGTVDLHLGQVDRTIEVGIDKICVSQVYAEKIALAQTSRAEIRPDQQRATKCESAKIGLGQLRTHEVAAGTKAASAPGTVWRNSYGFAGDAARLNQQWARAIEFGVDVETFELIRLLVAESEHPFELGQERCRVGYALNERYGLIEIPQKLVKSADDREGAEHRIPRIRIVPPRPPFERLPRNFLSGTETVENGASLEATRAQLGVDAACVVFVQIFAGFAGGFGERKVHRLCECQSHAAQSEAIGAIRPEVLASTKLDSCAFPHPFNSTSPWTDDGERAAGRSATAGTNTRHFNPRRTRQPKTVHPRPTGRSPVR